MVHPPRRHRPRLDPPVCRRRARARLPLQRRSAPHPRSRHRAPLTRCAPSALPPEREHRRWREVAPLLLDIALNTSRQLTYSPSGDKSGEHDAAWSPDGTSILFLAKRGDHAQLFKLSLQGGDAIPFDLKITTPPATPPTTAAESKPTDLTAINVTRYSVSPDGKTIALIAKDPETSAEKKLADEKRDAVWVDHDPHVARLYLLDLATEKLTSVPVAPDVDSVAWSAQSDRLVALTTAPNNAADLGPASTGWLVTLDDLPHSTRLDKLPPTIERVTWSPDGQHLTFLAQAQADTPPGYVDLYRYTFADTSIRNLSHGFAGSLFSNSPIPELGRESILASVGLGVGVTLARFDPAKDSPEPLTFAAPVLSDLSTNAAQTGWVYFAAGSTQKPTLYFTPNLTQPARALATPELRTPTWRSAASQLVRWTSDGLTIEGLLYLPPAAARDRVPLVVNVHGGPTSAWHDNAQALVDFLVGHGWAVLLPNPRGSTNYGATFVAANKNDLGGGDFRDIMTGVDAVIKNFPIDADRLALMGYSYGGEMAGFAVGKTHRFKAIVSGAPVINQLSEYGTEDSSWYDRWFYGKPWEHFADAWRQSPLATVAHATTPFLLLQGETDVTDPLGQAQEMYRALRQTGTPVDLIQYPREGHGTLAAGLFGRPAAEPWHGFDARERIVALFERAFQPVAPAAK